MCCSCKQPVNDNTEIIMLNDTKKNNDNLLEEEISNDGLTDKKLIKKINYLNKFKDNDSYNDYIIKLDDILRLENTLLDKKEGDIDENEVINSQIKSKDDSYTNS